MLYHLNYTVFTTNRHFILCKSIESFNHFPYLQELEDIEENNNCAIKNSENNISITPTPPPNDKSGKPSPPNQPRPLFQTIPVPNRARSPRPLSPKVPLTPPVEAVEDSTPQDVVDSAGESGSSPKRQKGSEVVNPEENPQQMVSQLYLFQKYV